ncbi:MAG: PadR family transcriptional regulator [Herpetosiphonaceae bacterium]|nr:PadR family transcriptional regulator [Herpetosiphonaceae bacterium]
MILDITQSEVYDKISQEFRRGILILAALSQLKDQKYGYALITQLAEHGLEIDQGTLYPLLRRLESQGLLDSSWNTEGSRPRRYYVINATGEAVLRALVQDWRALVDVMENLLVV